ncbi:hypothetical protein TrVE_jg3736 [Triparma verrucosa]|uniref:MYND-type domain-containing protein n=1 Tax=Triparma verrucosa TaxID=1606542 RepID=A0A9W7B3E3_9STRA|nr:hypothetical protein TrVE_jg3736 [Triparma verrucosa]
MSTSIVAVIPVDVDQDPFEQAISTSTHGDGLPAALPLHFCADEMELWEATPLLRASADVPSVMAYTAMNPSSTTPPEPNLRGTALAMACGLHGTRLTGTVVIGRVCSEGEKGVHNTDFRVSELCFDVDLRDNPDPALGWLKSAAMINYTYKSELARFREAFKGGGARESSDDSSSSEEEEEEEEETPTSTPPPTPNPPDPPNQNPPKPPKVKSSLCIHCRRPAPAENICKNCFGVHFCSSYCSFNAWSHLCVCPAWKKYTDRRPSLSDFPYLSFASVTTSRQFYESHEPYREYLQSRDLYNKNWWGCELDGWEGGLSGSAKNVDCSVRLTMAEGFANCDRGGIGEPLSSTVEVDEYGLPKIKDWGEYYRLRTLPTTSPVALLLHFPLTLFYGLQKFAKVQLEVSRMLKKSLTVHIVGVEKELNFLDMFEELFALFGQSETKLTLVFVVRKDMLPKKCSSLNIDKANGNTIKVVAGSYNDDLSPDFDCGTGKPDVVFGMNAGLYAYDSWRFVVEYLRENEGCLGIFTDYNEWSGLNCASLGGEECRDSLQVNPFRQPLALPVFSMNLPQFANGFFYVFNEQELE